MRAERRKYGDVEVIEIPGDGPVIVMMHGFGADANDLFGLHSMIGVPGNTRWIFPEGILRIQIAPGAFGRAWFPIDVEQLQAAFADGGRDLRSGEPPGMRDAREALQGMLSALDVDYNNLILSGFSQGGMMATDLALRAEQNPAGLAILSGTLVNSNKWEQLAPARAGLPFFQSHGELDPILPAPFAVELNTLLNNAGLSGQLRMFQGGHEIPMPVIDALGDYMTSV